MKTGRATEAHMYHQAFRRSSRANASVREGRHSGVRGGLLALQLSKYAERLYAAAEDTQTPHPAQRGRVKVLIGKLGGIDLGRLDSS